ncbi:MAG: hypothetical protein WAM14_13895 [Candidatus Nitrosopolaris sp.]
MIKPNTTLSTDGKRILRLQGIEKESYYFFNFSVFYFDSKYNNIVGERASQSNHVYFDPKAEFGG